jgi:hypothetical protein
MGILSPVAQERVRLRIVQRADSERRAASDSTPPHALNLTNAYLNSIPRLVRSFFVTKLLLTHCLLNGNHTKDHMDKEKRILIIGAGVFGLSTALELSRRGYSNITILDRHVPPVPDGSSVDISRVVRPDYADAFYARMGMEAIAGWQKDFSPFFYRSELLCSQSGTEFGNAYLKEAKSNLESIGAKVDLWSYTGREE